MAIDIRIETERPNPAYRGRGRSEFIIAAIDAMRQTMNGGSVSVPRDGKSKNVSMRLRHAVEQEFPGFRIRAVSTPERVYFWLVEKDAKRKAA